MFSHFSFPNVWSECLDPTVCEKIAHLPLDAETANSYPREWIDAAADGWVIEDDRGSISRYNTTGLLHCENGPAVEWVTGDKEWYQNEVLHRLDGPAIKYADGTQEWWLNGALHREDDPAVEHPDGRVEWWIHGEQVDPESRVPYHSLDFPDFAN